MAEEIKEEKVWDGWQLFFEASSLPVSLFASIMETSTVLAVSAAVTEAGVTKPCSLGESSVSEILCFFAKTLSGKLTESCSMLEITT